jgi:hypothetical protein
MGFIESKLIKKEINMFLRKCLLIAIVLINVNLIFGQDKEAKEVKEVKPFGLYEGMPISKLDIVLDGGGGGYIIKPPDASKKFDEYLVLAPKDFGLIMVSASETVETNVYGYSLKTEYENIQDMLVSNYGEPVTDDDYLLTGSIWNEPDDWLSALAKEERKLSSSWKVNGTTIYLYASCENPYYGKGKINLIYYFPSFDTYNKQQEEAESNKF